MAEGGGGPKRLRILNIVHHDEIWKDHVRHEIVSARHKWPETWGYLVQEYRRMNCVLEGRPVSTRPTSTGAHGTPTTTTTMKLPVIPTRQKTYPRTTSQEIGWKSVQNGMNSEMVTRYADRPRGKTTIFRKLKWPTDCQ